VAQLEREDGHPLQSRYEIKIIKINMLIWMLDESWGDAAFVPQTAPLHLGVNKAELQPFMRV
jgi:hypothetical protein